MDRFRKRTLIRTLIVLGVVLGTSLAVYYGLVVSVGVSQPLMLVGSNSMEPTIWTGDMIVIKSIDSSQIHLGDVIVYQKSLSELSILHRVVCAVTFTGSSCSPGFYPYINCYVPPCYYTKGDNNLAPDPWVVLPNEIRGAWTGFRVPYVGMSLICLEQAPACPTPWGAIGVVALVCAIASDLGLEFWFSRKPSNDQQSASEPPPQRPGTRC